MDLFHLTVDKFRNSLFWCVDSEPGMEICPSKIQIGKDDTKPSLGEQNPEVSGHKAFSNSAFAATNRQEETARTLVTNRMLTQRLEASLREVEAQLLARFAEIRVEDVAKDFEDQVADQASGDPSFSAGLEPQSEPGA